MNPYNVMQKAHDLLSGKGPEGMSTTTKLVRAEMVLENELVQAENYDYAMRRIIRCMARESMDRCKDLETIPNLTEHTQDILYQNHQTASALGYLDYYLSVFGQLCNGYCTTPKYTKET